MAESALGDRSALVHGYIKTPATGPKITAPSDTDLPRLLAGLSDSSLTAWAEHLRVNAFSPRTVAHRVRTIRTIARACGVPPAELTTQHVTSYLRANNYAPRTRENYLSSLKLYSTWAGLGDITAGVRRPPIPRSVPKPVGEVSLSLMLQETDVERPVYAWIVLGAYIGLRSAESAAVKAEDLEENGAGWALRVVGKGGVERIVPAPGIVVQTLQPWIRGTGGRGRLWPTATARAVQSAVRSVATAVSVQCSSHQLRHRYGTAVYRASRDLLLVQRLMGHSSPATTAGYAAVDLGDATLVIQKLPGANGERAQLVGALQ